MARPRIVQLDDILQSVMSLAVSEEEDFFYVASSSGLHEFILSTGRLVRTVKFQMCTDVHLVELAPNLKQKDGLQGKILIAAFSLSCQRFGLDQKAYIHFYPYRGKSDDRHDQAWTPALEISGQREWGRIRKLAYSKKQDSLFISTKFDHDQRGQYQNSAIWRVDVTNPGLGKLLIYREASSMWYMAINDSRDLLVVSERGDDYHHAIDIYDSVSGRHLKTVAMSPDPFPNPRSKWVPYGFIFWPRGVAIDSLGRIYVVDSARLQEFDFLEGGFVALIERFPFNNPKGVVLIERGHSKRRLYVIGSRSPRKVSEVDPIHKCALFVCDVQDWCPCEECVAAMERDDSDESGPTSGTA